MTMWRYTAIDPRRAPPVRTQGELAGESAFEVRASLRRIGLQVIDLRPTRRSISIPSKSILPRLALLIEPIRDALHRHLRARRRLQVAELYDGLATMLQSGLPLMEAVQTIASSSSGRTRSMLHELAVSLRSGEALDEAMMNHPAWFEPPEIAMVNAGRHGGELPTVLRALADRHQHAGDLNQKLLGALAYPALVALFGLAVVVFLSVKTLPDLAAILTSADLDIPRLTRIVMSFGQFLAGSWPVIGVAFLGLLILLVVLPSMLTRAGITPPKQLQRLAPRVMRRLAVATITLRLAELVRTGVPIVESLRILAPTTRSLTLRTHLAAAADAAERGEELDAALAHPLYFDEEFTRLLAIGQASGELPDLLDRIACRYQRQARRLIDRLAALLEPVVILGIALLVGVVVMAVILPLVQLQEIL